MLPESTLQSPSSFSFFPVLLGLKYFLVFYSLSSFEIRVSRSPGWLGTLCVAENDPASTSQVLGLQAFVLAPVCPVLGLNPRLHACQASSLPT